MSDLSPFSEIARQALTAYGIHDLPCTFLQHNENVTFKVTRPDGAAYLLRLHIPAYVGMGTHGADARVVKSEMLWLQALNHDAQLPVPYPLANKLDEFVTQIASEDGSVTNCTLLQWLDGEAYEHDMENEDTVAQIGLLVGKLHLHTSRWRLPSGFRRPTRDIAYFEHALAALQPALQDGRLSYQDFKTFETSIHTLTNMTRSFPNTRQTEGLLHGDLHRGNFIIHNGKIKLIDFSLCAFGNYMFDLGICLADMAAPLRSIMLLNYDRLFRLPIEYKRLIEGYFVGSFVSTFAFFIADPKAQETLIHRAPLIAREYAARFNNDERFWFDQS